MSIPHEPACRQDILIHMYLPNLLFTYHRNWRWSHLPCCSLQYVSLSFLHWGQSKHADIWAPTPTLSPILTDVTFGPFATTWPIISRFSVSPILANQQKSILPWPTTNGQCLFPSLLLLYERLSHILHRQWFSHRYHNLPTALAWTESSITG
jgi:hypothetical protein